MLPFLFQPGNLGSNMVGGTVIVLEQMPGKISKILEHHIDSGQVGVVGAGSSKGVPYGGYGCRGRGGNSFDQRGGLSPSWRARWGGNSHHWQGWAPSEWYCYHLKTRANWFGEKGRTPFVIGRVTQLARIFIRGRRGPSHGRSRWCSEWGRTAIGTEVRAMSRSGGGFS